MPRPGLGSFWGLGRSRCPVQRASERLKAGAVTKGIVGIEPRIRIIPHNLGRSRLASLYHIIATPQWSCDGATLGEMSQDDPIFPQSPSAFTTGTRHGSGPRPR